LAIRLVHRVCEGRVESRALTCRPQLPVDNRGEPLAGLEPLARVVEALELPQSELGMLAELGVEIVHARRASIVDLIDPAHVLVGGLKAFHELAACDASHGAVRGGADFRIVAVYGALEGRAQIRL